MIPKSSYRILLDERWALEDSYDFPRAYSQTYAFIYCLDSVLDENIEKRIDIALTGYPWKGGYSYINTHRVSASQTPIPRMPQVNSIQYASPGWLELLPNPDVAIKVAQSVGIYLGVRFRIITAEPKKVGG